MARQEAKRGQVVEGQGRVWSSRRSVIQHQLRDYDHPEASPLQNGVAVAVTVESAATRK